MKLREGSLTGVATALLCVRDLAALSVHPLLVHPTHYTGEEGYISDTEDTQVIHTGDTGQLRGCYRYLFADYRYADAVEAASMEVSQEKEEL